MRYRKSGFRSTRKDKTMFGNIDNIAQIEREIEKRQGSACEKNGWYVAVAMMPPKKTRYTLSGCGTRKRGKRLFWEGDA